MTWPMVPLKRVASLRVSNLDKKSVDGEVPVRLCNYTDVYYRDVIRHDQEFMAATATPAQISAFRLRPGDVVITKDSETADDIGVPAYVESGAPDLVCGYHLAVLRPEPSRIDGRFLYWSMASSVASEVFEIAATGVTRFGLRADAIGDFSLPVPTSAEQRAIAAFLDAETARIGALADKKLQLVARLLDHRVSTTVAAVDGRLTPEGSRDVSGLPWIETLPVSWRTAKLNLVTRLGSGHTPSREHPEWWQDCVVPWITTGEVAQIRDDRIETLTATREMVSHLGLANSAATIHPAGTVVLSRTASAGFSAIMGVAMATSQDFVTWTCGPLLEPRYLLLCLRAMRTDLLDRLAQGSTHKTIFMPDIESIRLPLPPLGVQEVIVEEAWRRFQVLDGVIDRLNRQIALLHERRQELITAAVTGELDIPGVAA